MMVRALGLGVAVLLLAGCSLVPAPIVSPTVSPVPVVTFVAPPQPDLGVVGTGTLDGVPFLISWDGTDFLLRGLGLVANPEVSYFALSPDAPEVGACLSGYRLAFGAPASETVPLAISGKQTAADPTFLTTISELSFDDSECGGLVVVSAPIDWSMMTLYPDLLVTDSGATAGASGEVTLEDSTPVSYPVQQGDVREEIAARFGITPDELVWLNPRRDASAIDFVINGETLNLSPSRR